MKLLSYLPFFIPLAIVTMLSIFSLDREVHFDYDEAVVYEISKFPISDILDTVQAEPHPPGFYVLVKTLSRFGKTNLKTLLTLIATLLTFVSLIVARKNKLLEKYNFSLGVSLFLGTSGFIGILSTVKQDIISFPLLMILFFMVLSFVLKKKVTTQSLIILHALGVSILFFGYIAYVESLLLILIVTLYFNKKRLPKLLLGFQISIAIFYLIFYGGSQLLLNVQRFSWLGEFRSSLINSTSTFFVSLDPSFVVTDIVLFVFFFFLFASFFSLTKVKRKEIRFGVSGTFLIALLSAYLTKSFVRDRYAAFVFFLACLLWGWGIAYSLESKFKVKNIATLFILAFFVVNIALYCVRGKTFDRQVDKLNNVLTTEAGVKTGFLIENPTLAYIYVREYGLGDKLVPINAYNPDMFKKEKIDREFLLSEGSVLNLSDEELAENLKIEEVEQYLYLMSIRSEETGYDPERKIFGVLSKNCSEEIVMFPDNVTILYKFERCNFN